MALTDVSLEDLLLRALAYAIVAGIAVTAALGLLRVFGTDRWAVEDDDRVERFFDRFDLFGFIASVLFRQGWIRMMLPDPGRIRGGRFGLVAWYLSTLAMIVVALWLLKFVRIPIAMLTTDTLTAGATALINTVTTVGVWFVLLNLLPIPPLLGSNLIAAAFPSSRTNLRKLTFPGMIILIGLMAFKLTDILLLPAVSALVDALQH